MNETDFHERGRLRARITDTHLVVFSDYLDPIEYPLVGISYVRQMRLPGGQTAVAMLVAGAPKSPGLTFVEPENAASFTDALSDAIARP